MYRLAVVFLDPFLLLLIAEVLAIANLWRTRGATTKRGVLLATLPLILLIVISLPVTATLALGSLEWHFPPQNERPEDAEAIVILSGALRAPSGLRRRALLGEDTLYRCLQGADLYFENKPCVIVVTGGKVDPTQPGPVTADAMCEFLRRVGVPESDIVVEGRSRTTHENAVETSKILRERGISKVMLVTDATHLMRSVRCFRVQGIEVIPSASYYRAPTFNLSFRDFMPRTSAARDVQRAWHEWVGMAWYWMHGRI